jgi:hypothetical protein
VGSGEALDRRRGEGVQANRPEHPLLLRACGAEEPRRVAEVLAHRQVVVERAALRRVTDPAAQRRGAGRRAEHVEATAPEPLDADDGAQQGRLAAAARPEQARDGAGADGAGEIVEDGPPAANDADAGGGDDVHVTPATRARPRPGRQRGGRTAG